MSSNSTFMMDEDGEFSDWIEIYNSAIEPINLSDYSLTDDGSNVSKWSFPDTVIQAGHFLVVFASGKNRIATGSELHTNFRINRSGETLVLGQNGDVSQSVHPVSLSSNKSFGLYPDGSTASSHFNNPTPGGYNNNATHQSPLVFSHSGGYYTESFFLELIAAHANAHIYYTIDGSYPDTNSLKYEGPLFLDLNFISPENINQIQISPQGYYYPTSQHDVPKVIVIRAAIIDQNGNPFSEVTTHSYFIETLDMHIPDLPIVSICGSYNDFFDENHGILVPGVHFNPDSPNWTGNYYQRGRDWERLINIEFFENNTNFINQLSGMRTHGGNGRRNPQKSLRVYARADYGESRFNHQLFPNTSTVKYKKLVFKPFVSSWSEAGIEDHIASVLSTELHTDQVGSRPVILYLNGEYWGIYYLQEKTDERFIDDNHSVDHECVDMIENWAGALVSGSNSDFLELYEFIETNELSDESNYQFVADQIDISNFIDYQLLQIYIVNYDWPANNMKCWKSQCGDNKWRWVFFDGDGALSNYTFDSFDHALSTGDESWPTNSHSTLFLRKLLQNDNFNAAFFARLEYLVEHQLSYENASLVHKEIFEQIENELVLQTVRFKFPTTLEYGLEQIENVYDFLANRPCEIVKQTEEKFSTILHITQCTPVPLDIECKLNTFPNPSAGEIHLSFQNDSASLATVHVADITGRVVYHSSILLTPGDLTLNISDKIGTTDGLYIISITTEDCTYDVRQLMVH